MGLCATTLQVAVAIIEYKNIFLLGYRRPEQHQGNCYEFIGGKIEANETPVEALIREVHEEIGLDLEGYDLANLCNEGAPIENESIYIDAVNHKTVNHKTINHKQVKQRKTDCKTISQDDLATYNSINPLGRIEHNYKDKMVALHVFRVVLNTQQFTQLQPKQYGCEGQPLIWVTKNALISGKYPLPVANATILQWLKLDDSIAVTYSIAHFILKPAIYTEASAYIEYEKILAVWLNYHIVHLGKNSTVYVRHKMDQSISHLNLNNDDESINELRFYLIDSLIKRRPDLRLILDIDDIRLIQQKLAYNRNSNPNDNVDDNDSNDGNDGKNLIHIIKHDSVAQHLTHAKLLQLASQLQADITAINTLHPDKPREHKKNKENLTQILESYLPSTLPITVSCHDATSILAANTVAKACIKAKFASVIGLFLSPVNPTSTHSGAASLGWVQFSQLAQLADVPVIALGGLKPEDLIRVRQCLGDKIAGIRYFLL